MDSVELLDQQRQFEKFSPPEDNVNFPYGSTVEMDGTELTFTKIENTTSGGVVCIFSDKKGKITKLTQKQVEEITCQ